MWFEQVKEWITWFFSLPLPIAGISIGTAGAFILIIISKTSLGKKMYAKAIAKCEQARTELKTYKDFADNKINELKGEYEEKLQLVSAQNEKLEKLLIAVSENIHNAKVETLVKDYCEKSHEIIAIADVVDDAIIETKEQCVKEAQSVIDEFKEKLQAEYDSKAKELDEQIAKYKEIIGEKVNEIGKETKE